MVTIKDCNQMKEHKCAKASGFPHLKEVKESNERCFAHMFLPVSEEEPPCDACVQQLWVVLGQRDQLKTLLATVPTTEKRPIGFINPRRPWRKVNQALPDKGPESFE